MAAADKVHPRFPLPIPAQIEARLARIRAAGGEVWVVGGAVRDALAGRPVRDWDAATTLEPAALAAALPEAVTRDLRLGVVRIPLDGGELVVTSCREEVGYEDRRHPTQVRFVADPARDARRRDFTVNAIYAEPTTGTLLDPCHGLDDLARRQIRAIGDPAVRLAEDPLRLLRGLRFAAPPGWALEPATAAAARAAAPGLAVLSGERVYEELSAAFTGEGRGRAVRALVDLGFAAVVLPEVVPMDGVPQPPQFHPEGDVLTHVCMVLDEVPSDDPILAWSAVLHDVGKPGTFERAPDRIRFSGHDRLSATMADTALRRLRAPRELREAVVEVCREHIRFATLPKMSRSKRERWLRTPRFPLHLAFHRADCAASHGDLRIWELARGMLEMLPPLPPPPLCKGADVLALGVPEGPMVGEMLRELERQLDGRAAPDRCEALEMLEAIVQQWIKPR